MAVRVICPGCGKQGHVAHATAIGQARCTYCKTQVILKQATELVPDVAGTLPTSGTRSRAAHYPWYANLLLALAYLEMTAVSIWFLIFTARLLKFQSEAGLPEDQILSSTLWQAAVGAELLAVMVGCIALSVVEIGDRVRNGRSPLK